MNILKFLLLLTIVIAATGQSHKIRDFWYTKTAPVTVSECGSDPLYYIDWYVTFGFINRYQLFLLYIDST